MLGRAIISGIRVCACHVPLPTLPSASISSGTSILCRHSPQAGPGGAHREQLRAAACSPSLCPHIPSPPHAASGDLPSQTPQEVLVAPWVRVDQGGPGHQEAPVGQGSQVGRGCPAGQRGSISWG